jgi:hypothetical protein
MPPSASGRHPPPRHHSHMPGHSQPRARGRAIGPASRPAAARDRPECQLAVPARPPRRPSSGMSELSEYEQLRLSHIKRNQEYLKLLGIEDGTFAKLLGEDKPAAAKKRVVKKKKRDPVDESQCRRSSRVRGAKPDYTGLQYDHTFDADRREAMDTEDEDEDEEPQQPAHLRHIRTAGRSDAEKEAEYAAIVADSRAWLASSRQALCLGGGGRTGPSTTDEWKAEAVRRWGARVGVMAVLARFGSNCISWGCRCFCDCAAARETRIAWHSAGGGRAVQ